MLSRDLQASPKWDVARVARDWGIESGIGGNFDDMPSGAAFNHFITF